jgi:vancomycin permeability regulator SanA
MTRRALLRAAAWTVAVGAAVFWLPWLGIRVVTSRAVVVPGQLSAPRDTALVLGGLARAGEALSETNRERLAAAERLFAEGLVRSVTVSNDGEAAALLALGAVAEGVPAAAVGRDDQAVTTGDSCRIEAWKGRSVVLVTHGYHLPRALFMCRRVAGIVGVAAEEVADTSARTRLGAVATARIRARRLIREAALDWLVVTGTYR